MFKKTNKNINIDFKTNKLNNIINNNIENYNKFEKKEYTRYINL